MKKLTKGFFTGSVIIKKESLAVLLDGREVSKIIGHNNEWVYYCE